MKWDESVPDASPGATPADAVTAFLNAEIAGDFAASFSLLSSDQRTAIGGVGPWAARHGQLPKYLSFDITDADDAGVVATDVTIEPRLDEIVGYMPSRATVTWTTVREGAGWTVSPDATKVDPVLPPDSGAASAALAWAGAAAGGLPLADLEYSGNLLGQPDVANEIRTDRQASFVASGTASLDDWPQSLVVTNAFGPAAAEWARIVELDGPLPIDVVTAPLGDRWLVVGVVAR